MSMKTIYEWFGFKVQKVKYYSSAFFFLQLRKYTLVYKL